MSNPITWQCDQLHDGLSAPTYSLHSSREEFRRDSVDRRACVHITEAEREELCAGRVPARLEPKEAAE
ncbi:hypothetical protein [Streptomyces sp. NPDC048340]|uniref:hypothetical protein n=1 Tax=Streptomyces sp. NPDC048340 TaxID=3365537 RepID=UPI00371880EA